MYKIYPHQWRLYQSPFRQRQDPFDLDFSNRSHSIAANCFLFVITLTQCTVHFRVINFTCELILIGLVILSEIKRVYVCVILLSTDNNIPWTAFLSKYSTAIRAFFTFAIFFFFLFYFFFFFFSFHCQISLLRKYFFSFACSNNDVKRVYYYYNLLYC